MKDLSITQEYMVCVVNDKGDLPGYNGAAVACLVVSGVLEMQLEKCISIEDKKVTVCTELPEHMSYLRPLYDVISKEKTMKIEKIVETYTISFTNKKLNELLDALMDGLKDADVVEPVKPGILGNKDSYAPKKDVVKGIIEKIRAELLEDGEISEDVIALTALLDKAERLKEYFSKYEQKELKEKIDEIRKSEAGITVKEMVQHLDLLTASIAISLVVSSGN